MPSTSSGTSDPAFKAIAPNPAPSEPPQVKVINAWAGLGALLVSHLLEVLAVVLSYSALMHGKLSPELYMAVVGGALVGPSIGKARGKLGPGTVGLVVASGAQLLSAKGSAVAQAAERMSRPVL